MTAPCKACPDRQEGCHSACDRDLAYRAERDRMIAERRLAADTHAIRNEAYERTVRPWILRKKRGG